MKCLICKRMIERKGKYQMCSNCQSLSIGSLIRKKIITIENLKKIIGVKDERKSM